MTQSQLVADDVVSRHPGVSVDLVPLTTRGDVHVGSLADHGGKGLFVTEVEQALLRGDADFAVHSMKDVPVTMPLTNSVDDLIVAAVPERADPRDVLVLGPGLPELPDTGRLGTSSPRRAMLMHRRQPDLQIVAFRGNVGTRLEKLRDGHADATLLAAAGLARLGLLDADTNAIDGLDVRLLDLDDVLPAAGQGALLVQCRRDRDDVADWLEPLDHLPTRRAVAAEREVVRLLDGDCHSAIAAFAEPVDGGRLRLRVAFAEDGEIRTGHVTGPDAEVAALAVAAARGSAP